MKFNEKLQKLRKENQMSQEQLADLLEVSRQAVSKWESGTTYPEMDKLLMLCKIFKCTLDELTNDDISDITVEEKEENKKKNWLNIILEYLKKTIHMIQDMSLKSIISMIIKMLLVFIFLAALCVPVYGLYLLGSSIFYTMGENIGKILSDVWIFLLMISYATLSITVFFYTFKIQYLDTYNPNKNLNTVKEQNSNEENADEKTKIQIVYKEVPTSSIFQLFGKLCTYMCKTILFFMTIPFLIFFAVLFIALIILIYGLFYEIFYIGFLVAVIFSILLVFVIVKFLMEVLFSRKINFPQMFKLVIISIAGIGISIGICLFEIADSKYLDSLPEQVEKTSISKTILYKNNLYVSPNTYFYPQDVYEYKLEYIEDNSLTDEIKIEVSYISGFQDPDFIIRENSISIYPNRKNGNIKNILLHDLRKKEFHNYDLLYDIEVTVYGNKNIIKLLKNNWENVIKNYEESELDSCRNQNNQLQNKLDSLPGNIDNLEYQLERKEEEIENLMQEKEAMQEELKYYKDTLQELLTR